MRLAIHKVTLKGPTKELPITIATEHITKIPDLIEKFRRIYTLSLEESIVGFEVTDIFYTMNLNEQQYHDELMMVDINDSPNEDLVDPSKVTTTRLR
jgi:hypothetical protein